MRLQLAGDVAALYARRATEEGKTHVQVAVEAAKDFNPVEMAYFCQQVVSHFYDVAKASMALTIFTNHFREAYLAKNDSADHPGNSPR